MILRRSLCAELHNFIKRSGNNGLKENKKGIKKPAAKNTEFRVKVDTSMTGACNEVLMFASMKGY
jgi:hypothetical protein